MTAEKKRLVDEQVKLDDETTAVQLCYLSKNYPTYVAAGHLTLHKASNVNEMYMYVNCILGPRLPPSGRELR